VGLESSVRHPCGKYMSEIDIPFTKCAIVPEAYQIPGQSRDERSGLVVVGSRVGL